jgi:hypothetical protein
MKLKTITLLAATAALAAACSPGPGSAEWCAGVIEGKIQATAAELQANSDKCEAVVMQKVKDALGGIQLPGQ